MSEDSKISKAQQKAVHKYVKINYDRIELTVKPKGKKEMVSKSRVDPAAADRLLSDRVFSNVEMHEME